MTYQATANEEDSDGDMLKVLSRPGAVCTSEVLKEDVRAAVNEDQSALNELGRRLPFLAVLPGAEIPGLHQAS